MIAVYLAMLETDVDRDKFMKLYESYEKKLFAIDQNGRKCSGQVKWESGFPKIREETCEN